VLAPGARSRLPLQRNNIETEETVWPSEPVAGLEYDRQRATEEKCTDHAALLAGLRDGSISNQVAYDQLRYMVYDALPDQQAAADETLGYLSGALLECIERLKANQETDLEKYVKDEFWRSRKDKRHDDFSGMTPDYRDKAAARKRGIDPDRLQTMYKVDDRPKTDADDEEVVSILETGARPPTETTMGDEYRTPSRLQDQAPLDTDHVAYTPLEQAVLARLLQDEAIKAIAEHENISTYTVEKIKRTFQERLIRQGLIRPDGQRLAG
jgi:hypothetical protein